LLLHDGSNALHATSASQSVAFSALGVAMTGDGYGGHLKALKRSWPEERPVDVW